VEVGVEVFISSVITGMEGYRAVARSAAETLGHTVTAAEDFRASPQSPQQVCLGAVRDADVVVLLLGARYGAPQESGISPTHEEYREARGTKPVLAFVQKGVTREPEQERFVEEVSTWEGGGYRESFDTPESLRAAVTRALHDWELSQQAGPVNEGELMARTAGLLPTRSAHAAGVAPLHVVVAGAPAQQLLRPGALDDADLRRDMQREAVYGDHPVFDPQQGVQEPVVQGTTLLITQPNAQITLDEQGNIRVSRPTRNTSRGASMMGGLPSLIEEEVREHIADGIRYTGWLLNRVDPTNRLRRVGLACRLAGIGYLPWRTRTEVAQSPNSASLGSGTETADSPPVMLARAALLFDTARLADDITVRLRRQVR
jgi:Domain of unknown function (DUF4062)